MEYNVFKLGVVAINLYFIIHRYIEAGKMWAVPFFGYLLSVRDILFVLKFFFLLNSESFFKNI